MHTRTIDDIKAEILVISNEKDALRQEYIEKMRVFEDKEETLFKEIRQIQKDIRNDIDKIIANAEE